MTRGDPDREEYADWGPPGGTEDSVDGSDPGDGDASDSDEIKPPTELRDPLPRDRIRNRLDVTPQQWYVLETFLLVAPYPVFALVYFTLDVNETAFLVVTLLYSVVATYVGLLS